MSEKKTLLQKYEIPVENLDFDFIRASSDARTVERIVKILRSGEEGHYPDLTRCAEERLRELKPTSKLFRVEEPALTSQQLDEEKRAEIESEMKSWIGDMRRQDQILKEIKPKENGSNKELPPIRKATNGVVEKRTAAAAAPPERIKSTDYSKWDKFDADAAVLKIDLDEERQREAVEQRNKKNLEKPMLIEVIEDREVDELSEFERERMSLHFKERGNEAFKAGDYEEAIGEYSQSIRFKKNAAAFNNRALVYLKKKEFIRVIADTNECLMMEPNNTKALSRKGSAFIGREMWREACDTFEKILQIEPENQLAQQELSKLQKKLPSATPRRIKIEEVDESKSEMLEIPESAHIPSLVRKIVPDDVTPFDKLLPKSDEQPREKLIIPSDAQPTKKSNSSSRILIQEMN